MAKTFIGKNLRAKNFIAIRNLLMTHGDGQTDGLPSQLNGAYYFFNFIEMH